MHTQTPGPYDDGQEASEYFPPSQVPTPAPGGLRRWKTVKKVELYEGNLVLDCPIPKKLLQQLPKKDEREYTHMR